MGQVCSQCNVEWDDELATCPDDGTALADPLIGGMLGSYRVLKQLGRGGMGGVYLGEHPVIGARVAIKVMHQMYARHKASVERFYNEARAVNLIGHDNVLKILDLGETPEGRPYFVMELLEGQSLQALLDQKRVLPLEMAGPMVLQICAALQAAHEKNIIHRDLKPENIFLVSLRGQQNVVKVVDFGIARLTDSQGKSSSQTQTGMVMGTPHYMSPEQASGATKEVDARSDVYSLGIIMYQLACGQRPFAGKNFGELLAKHIQTPPPAPRKLNPEIPVAYDRLILRALEKRPADRFQSMAELGRELRALLQARGIAIIEPRLQPASGRRPAPTMADTIPLSMAPPGDGDTLSDSQVATAQLNVREPRVSASPGLRARPPPTVPHASPTPPAWPKSSRSPTPQPNRAPTPQPARSPSKPGASVPKKNFNLLAMIGIPVGLMAAAGLWFVLQPEARVPRAKAKSAPAAPKMIALTIATDPPGAHLSASWPPDRTEHGDSPWSLDVPVGTELQLSIDLEGYASQVAQVSAGSADQTYSYKLRQNAAVQGHVSAPTRRAHAADARSKDDLINPF